MIAICSASMVWATGNDAVTVVPQKLFDAMKAHDSVAALALFAPGATLNSVDPEGKVTVTPVEKWAERMATGKNTLLERVWNPKVMEQGSIATVWAEYDFHSNGKFTHCGIDSFTLLKTESGWKIASLSFSRVTSSCAPSPLGEPAN